MNGIWASYRKTALLTGGPPLVLIALGAWQWRRAGLAEFEALSRLVSAGEILAGLAALVLSLTGLVHFGRLAREPLESGAALAEKFKRGLSFLPRLTLGLGLSLTSGLILAIFYELQYYWINLPGSSHVEFLLFFLGLTAVLVLGIFAVKLTAAIGKGPDLRPAEPEPITVLGRRVTVGETPRLWALVRSVAEKAGATPPDHLVAGLDGIFFATEAPVKLGWTEEALAGRTLYLSLPGLAYLNMTEIRAVIGHELGHFSGEDTVHGLKFGPIYKGAGDNLKAVHQAIGREGFWFHDLIARPLISLGEFFQKAFHLAVSQWNREREAAADRVGASAAGGDSLALALLRLTMLRPKIEMVWAEYGDDENRGPEGLMARLSRAIEELGLEDPADYLEESTIHPTDSHPPTDQRLADLGLEPDSAFMEKARDTSGAFSALTELGLGHEPAGAWPGLTSVVEEVLAKAAAQREDMATLLLRAAGLNGLERREFYERVWKTAALLGGGAWLFGAATVWTWGLGAGFVSLAVELTIVFFLAKLLIRPRRPFLTLTAKGFLVGELEEEIPWAAVRYTHAFFSYWTGTVTLALEPDYRPPAFKKDGRCRYSAKDHHIVCSVYGLRRPLKRDDPARILRGYLRGAQARAELESRGLSPEPLDPA